MIAYNAETLLCYERRTGAFTASFETASILGAAEVAVVRASFANVRTADVWESLRGDALEVAS